MENLKKDYAAVVDDINPDALSLGSIQKVLQSLLKELIPIKDLVQILEALIDYSKITKNVDVLTEYVRHSIGDTIANLYLDSNKIIHAATIGNDLENIMTKSLQNQKETMPALGLSPDLLRELNTKLQASVDKFKLLGYPQVIITSATIRPYFYRLVNSSFPDIAVLSYSELPSSVEVEFIDKLEVEYAD